MFAIAELTGLSLEEVCHSSISKWWSKVFENMGLLADPSSSSLPTSRSNNQGNIQDKERHEYEGGKVIDSRSLRRGKRSSLLITGIRQVIFKVLPEVANM